MIKLPPSNRMKTRKREVKYRASMSFKGNNFRTSTTHHGRHNYNYAPDFYICSYTNCNILLVKWDIDIEFQKPHHVDFMLLV